MVRGAGGTDIGTARATNVPGRDENSLDASRQTKNKHSRARKAASSKPQKTSSRKPLSIINENSLGSSRDISTRTTGVPQQGSESSSRTLVSTPSQVPGIKACPLDGNPVSSEKMQVAPGDATESSAREEQTEESLQDWLQRSYPDVTVNANAHPAVSELWDETARLRNLLDKVKDAELELAAQEAEEASKRELELESMLNVQWGRRVAFAEAATAGASRLAEHHRRVACQAESERDAARLQLGRAEEHAEHLAAKLKDQSDHLERLRADYARTSAALQKQKDAVDAGRAREEVGNGRLKEVEAELAAYLARRTQERDEAEAAQVQAMNEIEQLTADNELLQTEAELQRLEAAQATAALKAATAERSGTSNQDTALNYSLQNEIHKLNAALLANAKGTGIDDDEGAMRKNGTVQELQKQVALLQAAYAEALRMGRNLSDSLPETTSEVTSTNQETDLTGMLEAAQVEAERFSAAHAEAAAEAEQLGALYMSAIEEQETLKANHNEEICKLNRQLEVLASQAKAPVAAHANSSAEIDRLSTLYSAAMAEIDELKRVAHENASPHAQGNADSSDAKDKDSREEVVDAHQETDLAAATEMLVAGTLVERADGVDLVAARRGEVEARDVGALLELGTMDEAAASDTIPCARAPGVALDSLAASAGAGGVTSHTRTSQELEERLDATISQSARRVEALSTALAGAEEEGARLALAHADAVAEVEKSTASAAAAVKETEELRRVRDEATRGLEAHREAEPTRNDEQILELTQAVESMKQERDSLVTAHAQSTLEVERLTRLVEEKRVDHEVAILQMQERMCEAKSQASLHVQELVGNTAFQTSETNSFEVESTVSALENEIDGINVHLAAARKNALRLEVVEKESSGQMVSLTEPVSGLAEQLACLQGDHAVASAEVERLTQANLATIREMEGLQTAHEDAIQTLQEQLRDAWSQGVDQAGQLNAVVAAMKSENTALLEEMARTRSAHDGELMQMQERLKEAAAQHATQVEELESTQAEVERMTELVSSALEAAAHLEAAQGEEVQELQVQMEAASAAAAEEREALCVAHAEALSALRAQPQAPVSARQGTPPSRATSDVSKPPMDSDSPFSSTPGDMNTVRTDHRACNLRGSLQYSERCNFVLSKCTPFESNSPASLSANDVRWRYNAVYSETMTGPVAHAEFASTSSPAMRDSNTHDTFCTSAKPENGAHESDSIVGESENFEHKEADQEASSPNFFHSKQIQELTDTVSELKAEIQRLEGPASEAEQMAERCRVAVEEKESLKAAHQDEVQRLQHMLDVSSMSPGAEYEGDSTNMQTVMEGEVERLSAALADTTEDLQRLAALNTDTRVEMEQLRASHARALQRRQDELEAAQSQVELYTQQAAGAALETDTRTVTEVDDAGAAEAARIGALYEALVEEQCNLKASHEETVQKLQRQVEAMEAQSAELPADAGAAAIAQESESAYSSETREMKGQVTAEGHDGVARIQELMATVALLKEEVDNLQAAKSEATEESERMCELYLAAVEEQERIKTAHEEAARSSPAVQDQASAAPESRRVDELTGEVGRLKGEVEHLETALADATAESERLSALYLETVEELEVTQEQAVQLLQDQLEEVAAVEGTEQTELEDRAEECSAALPGTELAGQSASETLQLAEKVTNLQDEVRRLLSENEAAVEEVRRMSEMYLAAVDTQDCLKAAQVQAIQRLQLAVDGSGLSRSEDRAVVGDSSEPLQVGETEALSAAVASATSDMQRLAVSSREAKLEMQQLKAHHERAVLRMEEEVRAARVQIEQHRGSDGSSENSETRRLQVAHADAAAELERLSAMYRVVVEELEGLKSAHASSVQEMQCQLRDGHSRELEQVSDLVDTVKVMKVQIDTLTVVYEDATEHIRRLTSLNDSTVKEMSKMKADHEQAIALVNEHMEVAGSQMLLQVKELSATMAAMKSEINRLESAHADAAVDSRELVGMYQAAVQEAEHVSETYDAALHDMRKQLQIAKDHFSNQIGELCDTASSMQNESRRLEQKHAEAAADSERLYKLHQSTVTELDAVKSAHQRSSSAMQQQLEAAGTKHMLELEGLARTVGNLMALTDKLETANAEAEAEARGLGISAEDNAKSLRSTVHSQQVEIECLKAQKKVAEAAGLEAERVSELYLAAVVELEALKTAHEQLAQNSQQQQQRTNTSDALSDTSQARRLSTNLPVMEATAQCRGAGEAAQQEQREVAGVLASGENIHQQSSEGADTEEAIGCVDVDHSDADTEADQVAKLKAQIAEARVAAAHVRKVQSEACAQMQSMQAAEEAAETRYQELRVRHGLATQEVEQLKTANAASCEYVTKLEDANSTLEAELSRVKSAHAEVAEEAGILKSSATRHEEEICRLSALLENSLDSRTKISQLQAELDSAHNQIARLECEVGDAGMTAAAEIEALQAQCAYSEMEVETLKASAEYTQREMQRLQSRNAVAEEERERWKSDHDRLLAELGRAHDMVPSNGPAQPVSSQLRGPANPGPGNTGPACSVDPAVPANHNQACDEPKEAADKHKNSDSEAARGGVRSTVGYLEEVAKLTKENAQLVQQVAQLQSTKASLSEEKRKHEAAKRRAEGHVAKLKDFNEKAIQEIQLLNVELKDSRTFQEAAAKQANEDFMLLREQINLHVQWVQTKHSASQDSTPSALEEGSTPVAKDPDSGALPTSAAEDVTSLQAELELSKTQVETLLARQAASEDKIAFLTMNNKSLVDEVLGLKEEARRLHVPVGCAEDVCGTNVASDSNDKGKVCEVQVELLSSLMDKQHEAHEAGVARAAAEEQRLRTEAQRQSRELQAAEADAEFLRAALEQQARVKAALEKEADVERRKLKAQLGQQALEAEAALRLAAQRQRAAEQQAAVDRNQADLLRSQVQELQAALETQTTVRYHQHISSSPASSQSSVRAKPHTATPTPFQRSYLHGNSRLGVDPMDLSSEMTGETNEQHATPDAESHLYSFGLDQALSFTGMNSLLRMTPSLSTEQFLASLSPFSNVFNSSISHSPTPAGNNEDGLSPAIHLLSPVGIGTNNTDGVSRTSSADHHRDASAAECTPHTVGAVVTVLADQLCVTTPSSGGYGLTRPTPRMRSRMCLRTGRSTHGDGNTDEDESNEQENIRSCASRKPYDSELSRKLKAMNMRLTPVLGHRPKNSKDD